MDTDQKLPHSHLLDAFTHNVRPRVALPPRGGSAGDCVPVGAVLGQNARLKERLGEPEDTPVSDPSPHPLHKSRDAGRSAAAAGPPRP